MTELCSAQAAGTISAARTPDDRQNSWEQMTRPESEYVFGSYRVAITRSRPPLESCDVVFDSIVTDAEGTYAAIRVESFDTGRSMLIEFRTAPLFFGGFSLGCLIVPETGTCFVGGGKVAATYDLIRETLIESRKLDCGFWSWHRHLLGVVMLEELSIAVWTLQGRQLWERFADPPHTYELSEETRIRLKDCRGEFVLDFETGRHVE